MEHEIKVGDRLKMSMQKEVDVLREVLANMHQEELSLLMQDKTTWNQVMQERALLIQRLGELRTIRIQVSKEVASSDSQKTCDKGPWIEEENKMEVLSLRDQLMALMERLNTQVSRNEELFKQLGNKLGTPLQTLDKVPSSNPRPQRRKPTVATYSDEDYYS